MYIELKTERLLLRPLDVSDLKTVHRFEADAETAKYMLYPPDKSLEDTKRFLERISAEWKKETPSLYEFAVIFNLVQIGIVSLYIDQDKTEGELGWIFDRQYWGKGYATEAALAVKDFAIRHLKVKKITAYCDSRNINSARVMERIGLTFESRGERQYPDERGTAEELKYSCVIADK